MATDNLTADTALLAGPAALKTIESKGMSSNVRVPFATLAKLPGFNVRSENDEYKAAVRSLADSIKANGFYDHKPLGVFKIDGRDGLFIHDGHTRFDALALLLSEGTEIAEVPVALAPQGTTVEDLTVSLVQSNEGRPLAPIELAAVVKRLLSFKDDKNWVAERIGKTVRYLDNLLILAGAPAAVRTAVANNKIAAAEAVKIVRKDPKTAAATVAAKVKEAEAKGKAKATPKTATTKAPTGPKMKRIPMEFSVPEGDKMADVLKGIAKRLREEFGIDKDDKLEETGSIQITVIVIDHEAQAAAQAKVEAAAAAATAKADAAKAAAAAATTKVAAERKPAKPAKAAAAPAADKPKRTRKPAAAPAAAVTEPGETPEVQGTAQASLEAGVVPAPGTPEGDAAQAAADGEAPAGGTGDDGMGGL